MAAAPTLPLVPVDEYLNTSYDPDVEYVDGVLVKKGMPTIPHQLLAQILQLYFRQFEKEFQIKSLADVRTQIIERARYRLPDVMVFPVPLGRKIGRVMIDVPCVIIEIQSPDDTNDLILDRFADYTSIGVIHCILMHPEKHIAWRHSAGSLIRTDFQHLAIRGRELPFDTLQIFEQLREEIRDIEGDLPILSA